MDRGLLLLQVSTTSLTISIFLVLAYGWGGRKSLWSACFAAVVLLEIVVFAGRPDREGPDWLTGFALIPPVLAIALAVQAASSRRLLPWMQVALGFVAGLVAYALTASAAYMLYMHL